MGGVAELLPFLGKSEAYTPGKGGGEPRPPLRGWSKGKQFSTIPVSPIRKFFRPKVPFMSKVQCSLHTVYENLTPTLRYSRANQKKREGSWKFLPYLGVQTPKNVFLTTFRPLTPSRGRFEARNKRQKLFPDRFRAF